MTKGGKTLGSKSRAVIYWCWLGVAGSRLGVSPQIASALQTSGMPIDATYLDDGKVDFSGVADNQVLRQRGTFVKYSQETGQAYPVVFDVDRDTFVSENTRRQKALATSNVV